MEVNFNLYCAAWGWHNNTNIKAQVARPIVISTLFGEELGMFE